jgi:hypothetical protein
MGVGRPAEIETLKCPPTASRTQEPGVALSIRQGISVADGLLNEPISHDPR